MIQTARRSPAGRWLLVAGLTSLTACAARGSALAPLAAPTPPAAPTTQTRPTTVSAAAPVVTEPSATTSQVTETVVTVPVVTATVGTAGPSPAVAPVTDTAVSSTVTEPDVRSGANVNADADATIGDPISISIPSIGVESLLVPSGVQADGTMAVPADASIAGWFTGGPKPGQRGPAVIMGHVDQKKTGPGVFWHLRDLQVGAHVTIHTTTGDVVFVAQESDLIGKDEFPTERVYGAVPAPALRLITCGGSFDRKIGHYRSNVVVYLVPEVAS